MIRLNKITFKNFKIFGNESYTINFEDNRLVLLDGPNGYGKTSVFDGIELGLTGNIDRLISLESRQNPTDIVVAHQGNSLVEITLEFKDADSRIRVFQRKLKDTIPNSLKKISKFNELWELNEIVDGQVISLNQVAFDHYFNSQDFKRDFLLFHYVQQEDTSRFLKGNEVQRAETLAQLFGDTHEADEKLQALKDIQQKIGRFKRTITNKITATKQRYNIDENSKITTEVNESHTYLFPWLAESNQSPFWDSMNIPELNQEKLNFVLEELTHINNFLMHKNYFLRSRIFEKAIGQREVLELYLSSFNSIKNYNFYELQIRKYQTIKIFHLALLNGDFSKASNTKNLEKIFLELKLEGHEEFRVATQSLVALEKKAAGLSSIYSELIKHHSAMFEDLQKTPDEFSCVLCGQDYQSHDSLSRAVSQHGILLRSELSEQDKALVSARDSYQEKYLSQLNNACSNYIEQTRVLSQEELFSLSKAVKMKERFEKLRSWLIAENISHDDLLFATFPLNSSNINIIEAADILCERIRATVGTGTDGYYESNSTKVFDRVYRDYFNSQQKNFTLVSVNLLEHKQRYIKNLYFNSLKNIMDELEKLSKQNLLFVQAFNNIGNFIDVLQKKIKQYRKKLITDIEIPFFIYSGKILQSHQAGLGHGIFIKDPTGDVELKNVRLVSNWDSDHDILNTMSSGQVSAIVIALTLALHKVYASSLSSILIDDPVQTMDDINMSSLVEILRNDFKDKQIILSTHEDKVARYFTYKYLKYNESVKIVNLMKRQEYIPSNNFIYSSKANDSK
ncbi:MAG: energy-coupling factor transporter ATP-binding protein EcfA2 [Cocleimonas sp.]|jgi:energy-coupling factor transporter ATP-binding protein EcfA2